jgi:hypothetical protein
VAVVERDARAMEEGSLDRPVLLDPRDGRLPRTAVLTFGEGGLEEPEPRLGLGLVAADFGDAAEGVYVPRAPKTGSGPEHFTFTVRQGVR